MLTDLYAQLWHLNIQHNTTAIRDLPLCRNPNALKGNTLILGFGKQARQFLKLLDQNPNTNPSRVTIWTDRPVDSSAQNKAKKHKLPVSFIHGVTRLKEATELTDLLVNCLPLTKESTKRPSTLHLIDRSLIEGLKVNTAILSLSNTDVFDTEPLIEGMADGNLMCVLDGLGIEVEQGCPLTESSLFKFSTSSENVGQLLLLPHCFGSSLEAQKKSYISMLNKVIELATANAKKE